MAVAALAVAAVVLASAWAVYSERSARDAARTPVPGADKAAAAFLWLDSSDAVGSRDAQIITIEPLVADAPLPPGLTEWPSPGQVVLSPAMAALDPSLGIDNRYGDLVGVVASEGLASSNELLAYVRPAAGTLVAEAMYPSVAYGGYEGRGMGLGEVREIESVWMFLLAAGLLLTAPAALLMVAAARVGEVERSRQATVLLTLGMGPRARWAWAWGNVGRAFLTGAAAALAATVVLVAADMPVPGTGYSVSSRDVRAHLGLVVVALAAALSISLILALRAARPHQGPQTRLAPSPVRWSRARAAACAGVAPLAVAAALLTAGTFGTQTQGGLWVFIIYFAAVVVTLILLPHLLGTLMVRLAASSRSRAVTQGDAPRLIASAAVAYDGRAVVRTGWALAACLVLATQVQGYLTVQGESLRTATAANAAAGGAVLEIVARPELQEQGAWTQVLSALDEQIPQASQLLLIPPPDTDGEPGPTLVVATADDLAALGLPDGGTVDLSTPGAAGGLGPVLAASAPGPSVEVVSTDVPLAEASSSLDLGWQTQGSVLLVDPSGAALPSAEVHRIAARTVAPMMRVLEPGQSWLIGLSASRANVSWVALFAVVGMALLTAALLASGVDDLRRFTRRLTRLAVLTGRRGLVARVVVVRTGLPLLVSAAVGGALSLLLLSALFTGARSPLSGMVVAATATMVGMVIVVGALVAAGAIRSARLSETLR